MKIVKIQYLLFLVLSILVLVGCNSKQNADIIISNINVIDVVQGKLINSQDVIISGDQIIDILSHDEQEYQAKELINGEGKYLIPGLWDMHVHTGNADIFFPLYIANGITGVRDMGGGMETSTGNLSVKFQKLSLWRNEVIQGKRLGPEMVLAGSMIDGSPAVWPGTIAVTDSSSIHTAVHAQKELGVDFIKVYHNLNINQLREVSEAVKKLNMDFVGHIPLSSPPLETLLEVSRLGQSSIEHMINVQGAIAQGNKPITSYLEAAYAARDVIGKIDIDKEKILYDTLLKNNTWLTPTVSIWWGIGQLNQPHKKPYKQWLEYIPERIATEWNHNPFQDTELFSHPPEDYEAYRGAALSMAKVAKRMHDAGVNLMAASDSENPGIVPGYGLHKELELLVLGGFTPAEVLRLATVNPAKFLNRTDIGIISVGAKADLVILDADPLNDITNTSLIDGVILQGKYLERWKLDELLKQAEIIANKK